MLVDDILADRKWIEGALKGTAARPGPFANSDIVVAASELANVEEYELFDGILLDWRIGKTTGPDIAQRVRDFNWRRPVRCLITGATRDQIPSSVYQWFHYVVSKDDIVESAEDFWWTLRRMATHMAQVRAAYDHGKADGIAEATRQVQP